MKKGCIIAIVVVLVLGLIIGGVAFYFIRKGVGGIKNFGNAAAVFAVEAAIEEYKTANPDAQVEATNEAWAAALQDFTSPSGTDITAFMANGQLVDINQNPLGVDVVDGAIKLTSPGEDGQLGTGDDVTAEAMEKLEAMGTEGTEGTEGGEG